MSNKIDVMVWDGGHLVFPRSAKFFEGEMLFAECDKHSSPTVMQYIGRKDINGKKIYNDFIVQCELGIKYKVVFSDEWCAFMLIENKTGRQVVIYPEMQLEVIGNLYENPELLEK